MLRRRGAPSVLAGPSAVVKYIPVVEWFVIVLFPLQTAVWSLSSTRCSKAVWKTHEGRQEHLSAEVA